MRSSWHGSLKLKGITMYRTGSRKNVVLSLKDPGSGSDEKNPENACTLN